MPEVRPAGDAEEVAEAVALLARAAFGAAVGRLVAFPRDSPSGTVLVTPGADGALAGAACCASFGATGWIGALGVAQRARRGGLGTALTEAAIAWLRERGATTVLLYATPMGRPVYERLGFEVDGNATAWRGTAGMPPGLEGMALRALTDGDRSACAAIDRATTGEDRAAVLDAVRPLHGVAAVDRAGTLHGFAAVSPWGVGTSIAAMAPEVGVALMGAAARGPGPAVLVVPDANRAAAEALRRWRFLPANDGLRMRLGPSIGWRPERQFGLFNLFWG